MKQRRIADRLMELLIVQNPHIENPADLYEKLQSELPGNMPTSPEENVVDRDGLMELKKAIMKTK